MTVGQLRHAIMGRRPGEQVILLAPSGHFHAGTYSIGPNYFGLVAGAEVEYEENAHAEPPADNAAGPPCETRGKQH